MCTQYLSDFRQVIKKILKRPLMYIACKDLENLWSWICGFQLGLYAADKTIDHESKSFSDEFNDWVAYKLHYSESTSGWVNMIMNKYPCKERSWDIFKELFQSYFEREEKVIAEFTDKKSLIQRGLDGVNRICLIKYSDDPGFFVVSDGPNKIDGFYSDMDMVESFSGIPSNRWSFLSIEPEENNGRRSDN